MRQLQYECAKKPYKADNLKTRLKSPTVVTLQLDLETVERDGAQFYLPFQYWTIPILVRN